MKRIQWIVALAVLMSLPLDNWAQAPVEQVKPVTSTEGMDFFVTWPVNADGDFATTTLQLHVSSRQENNVVVEYGGDKNNNKGQLIRTTVLENSSVVIDVPAIKGMGNNGAFWGGGTYYDISQEKDGTAPQPQRIGIRVYSENRKPMTVYATSLVGGSLISSYDGMHILPIEALGYEYVSQSATVDAYATEFIVMAAEEGDTHVTINPSVDISLLRFDPTEEITLKYRQAILIRAKTVDPNSTIDVFNNYCLTGTRICADKRIAVWSGNQQAKVPAGERGLTSNFAVDQLLPVNKWGKDFVVPMTGIKSKMNEVHILALENGTNVKVVGGTGTRTYSLGALVDSIVQVKNNTSIEDSTLYITSNKPIQVYLFTSSAQKNIYQDPQTGQYNFFGDPSMTLIAPVSYATDTMPFSTFEVNNKDNSTSGTNKLAHRLNLWVKSNSINSVKLDGVQIPSNSFKNVPGTAEYKIAKLKIDIGYHVVTADQKSFGGYIYGMADAEAYLYPLGYDFLVHDSLFLADKLKELDGKVRESEWSAKYPEGGGWYLDKQNIPSYPTQYDTVFVCDSAQLKFPLKIHNDWDSIKWEVMRINQGDQKRKEYKDDAAVRQTGGLTKPFIETKFYMLPEKERAPKWPGKDSRHPYEDFEVRAILYRQPTLCEPGPGDNIDKWPRDTLSTIVRAYRSYNDTTWLIKCTNDKAIDNFFVDPKTKEKTVINCDINNPVTPDATHIQLQPGENGPYQRRYLTVNGCDSIVTLYVLLCESKDVKRDPDYICESELEEIEYELGKGEEQFFKSFRLAETLQRHKKEIKDKNQRDQTIDFKDGWVYFGGAADNLSRTWRYTGSDTRSTSECNEKMEEWNSKYRASYPRSSIGCDNKLTIELHVLPMEEYEYDTVICKNEFKWKPLVNRANNPKYYNDYPVIKRSEVGSDVEYSPEPYYYTPKGVHPGWNTECPTEKHILHITFTNGYRLRKKVMCDDDKPFVLSKEVESDIIDENFEPWVFDPNGKQGTTTYSPKIPCRTNDADGCEYELQYQITVNEVERHIDTLVYCYGDGSKVPHIWDGHPTPWVMEKGKPNTKKRYAGNQTIQLSRPDPKIQKTPIIYELTDTTLTSSCHIVYRQTVIMMPVYNTSDKHDAISTEEWFEWQNIIWAGEDVWTDTISNSKNLTIVTLKEFGRIVPDGYTVEYIKADSLYAITTTTTTVPHKSENEKGWTAVCDSTVQLTVQVAHVQREKSYWYRCSCDSIYTWYAGGVTPITINLKHVGEDNIDYATRVNNSKDSLTIHIRVDTLLTTTAKRVDANDSRKGQPSYGVAGIKAEFDHYLTIFPSYVNYIDTTVCQEPGKTIKFKGVDISLDEYGPTKEKGNGQETKPKTWINHNPYAVQASYEVKCDSGEIVRAIVMPLYRDDLNKEMATHRPTLHTHDTLRFFTEPEVLFVGMDFFTTHPQIANMDELKEKAGVDSVVLVDEVLVPDLIGHDESHYECEQKSANGSRVLGYDGQPLGCDSTTFLDLQLKRAQVLPPVEIGDNGHWLNAEKDGLSWSFGGDTTTRYDGSRYHTQYYMDGDYFQFYYDEDGNVIGEVPFDEEDPYNRRNAGKGDYNYSENEDGTRTYLLIDSVLDVQTGKYEFYVQAVTVYPTYMINYRKKMGMPQDTLDVCADDELTKPWNGKKINVADVPTNKRIGIVADTLVQKRYLPEHKVDSILYMYIRVWGNPPTNLFRPQCYNTETYKWRNVEGLNVNTDVSFDPAQPMFDYRPLLDNPHQVIRQLLLDTIMKPALETLTCKDYLTLTVDWMPAYGIEELRDDANAPWFSSLYLDPYVAKTTYCFGDQHPHWILPDGTEHFPANLYDQDGNKIADNRIPTDLEIGATYIVRDSLKTKGCQCDSVLTLYYTLEEAPAHVDTTITACEKEVVDFKGIKIPISRGMKNPIDTVIDNGTGCPETYTLHFVIDELTRFSDVKAGPICYGATEYDYASYTITYSYKGTYAPVSYSVYYSDEAKDSLHVYDLKDQALPGNLNPGEIYELTIPLPAIDGKEDYPTPGVYKADVAFNNGKCASDEFMKTEILLDVRYPSWIMQQRHGDMIVIRDSADNGNRRFTAFQWYKDGRELPGQVGPYLYMPGGLEPGAEYYVLLTEPRAAGDTIVAPVCALTAVADPGDDPHGPTYDYLDVVPTCVPVGRTTINIVSNETNKGTYRLSTIEGQYISSGEFTGPATAITIPSVEGMYIVQVWADNKESIEPYRAIKVVVGSLCQE